MTICLPPLAQERLRTIGERHLGGLRPAAVARVLLAYLTRLGDDELTLIAPALRRRGRAA